MLQDILLKEMLSSLNPLTIDIIIAALIILAAFIKAKIGFFQSVMKLVVVVLALAIGFAGADILQESASEFVWEKCGPILESRFDDKAELSTDEGELSLGGSEAVQQLKLFTLAKAKIVCDKICHFALFLLVALASLIVLNWLKNLLGNVANFSVIGWMNHGLGFLFGALEMTVILLLIVRGEALIGSDYFIRLSEGTTLLKWFTGGTVAEAINAFQNLSFEDFKDIDINQYIKPGLDNLEEQIQGLVQKLNIKGL